MRAHVCVMNGEQLMTRGAPVDGRSGAKMAHNIRTRFNDAALDWLLRGEITRLIDGRVETRGATSGTRHLAVDTTREICSRGIPERAASRNSGRSASGNLGVECI